MDTESLKVTIFWADLKCTRFGEVFSRTRTILSSDEIELSEKFKTEELTNQYISSHLLLRTALSRLYDTSPNRWQFKANRWGRPEILSPLPSYRISFNLSHCRDFAVCAIACGIRVGIDVEATNTNFDQQAIIDSILSPKETSSLFSHPTPDQRKLALLKYWTLKEAYSKARGRGLSLPIKRTEFESVDQDQPVLTKDLGKISPFWHFRILAPEPNHTVALACRNSSRLPIVVFSAAAEWLY